MREISVLMQLTPDMCMCGKALLVVWMMSFWARNQTREQYTVKKFDGEKTKYKQVVSKKHMWRGKTANIVIHILCYGYKPYCFVHKRKSSLALRRGKMMIAMAQIFSPLFCYSIFFFLFFYLCYIRSFTRAYNTIVQSI
jgi:hypothetical protein